MRLLTENERARILEEQSDLKKCSTQWLREMWQLSHKVSDTRELTRSDLITFILCDRHGEKRVAEVLRK